jgi:hypothetical protein
VKATSCACGCSCFIWHNPESIQVFQLKPVQVLTLLGIFKYFRKTEIVAYYCMNVANMLLGRIHKGWCWWWCCCICWKNIILSTFNMHSWDM